MTYNYITHPNTGESLSIFSKSGKSLLKQYIVQIGGSGNQTIREQTREQTPRERFLSKFEPAGPSRVDTILEKINALKNKTPGGIEKHLKTLPNSDIRLLYIRINGDKTPLQQKNLRNFDKNLETYSEIKKDIFIYGPIARAIPEKSRQPLPHYPTTRT